MLNHIIEYALTHVPGSERGFTMRQIQWLVRISIEGRYINIEPYGGKGPDARRELKCPDMPNMRAGKDLKRAHFLVETATAAVLYVRDKKCRFRSSEDKTIRRNQYFQKLLDECADAIPALRPAQQLFSSSSETELLRLALADNAAAETDWLILRIADYDPLADDEVLSWWRSWLAKDRPKKLTQAARKNAARYSLDFVSGILVEPLTRHPTISGLKDVGASQPRIPLICFDKTAFTSYGLKEGANASMSAIHAQLYADGLTHLLKTSHKIAGSRIVYWYRKDVLPPDDAFSWLTGMYTNKQIEAGAVASLKNLLQAIESGKKPELADNWYFAMTLSAAGGRAMVRDWMEGSLKDLAENIAAWFSDLEVVAYTGKSIAPEQKLETIVTSILGERKQRQKYEDWIKPIGSARHQLIHAALRDRAISRLIVQRLAAQLPAFLISDDVQKILFPPRERSDEPGVALTVSRLYSRMGLIRAYFVRLSPGGEQIMKPYLNPHHKDAAYHCGRLLAVVAHLQHEALEDVGANVVQRFYAGFSQAPGLHLGRIVANAQNHLASVRKKSPGLASCYEDVIAEINGRLRNGEGIQKLNLEEQGLFAIGYYQQLAQLRAERVCNIAAINREEAKQ